jgi:hypothetical protein
MGFIFADWKLAYILGIDGSIDRVDIFSGAF